MKQLPYAIGFILVFAVPLLLAATCEPPESTPCAPDTVNGTVTLEISIQDSADMVAFKQNGKWCVPHPERAMIVMEKEFNRQRHERANSERYLLKLLTDSALLHYAPHTNLQTDTSNYRDEIRRLKAENLNLAKHNANLSLLISQQRARILADEIKLRHCVWIQDTVNIKK